MIGFKIFLCFLFVNFAGLFELIWGFTSILGGIFTQMIREAETVMVGEITIIIGNL